MRNPLLCRIIAPHFRFRLQTPTLVSDVSTKIDILAEQQEDLERARKETLVNLITIFGVISILASVLDIVQTLSSGGTFIWTTTIVTNVALLLVLGLAMRINK